MGKYGLILDAIYIPFKRTNRGPEVISIAKYFSENNPHELRDVNVNVSARHIISVVYAQNPTV